MIRTFQNALEREGDSFFLTTGECSKTFWEAHKHFLGGEWAVFGEYLVQAGFLCYTLS